MEKLITKKVKNNNCKNSIQKNYAQKANKKNILQKFKILKNKQIKNNKELDKQKNKYLLEKAKNKNKLRVIYKAPNKDPEVKIIPNVFTLKKAIINRQLEIIPYQNVFIIFNKQKEVQLEPINIILDLCNIKGDLLIVQIDPKKREFESVTQENIIWFTQDLINKSPVGNINTTKVSQNKNNVININDWKNKKVQNQNEKELTKNNTKNYYSKELTLFDTEEKAVNTSSFENDLINVLTNIELTLASLLEIKKN